MNDTNVDIDWQNRLMRIRQTKPLELTETVIVLPFFVVKDLGGQVARFEADMESKAKSSGGPKLVQG